MADWNQNVAQDVVTASPEWARTQEQLQRLGTGYNPYNTDFSNVNTQYRDMGFDLEKQNLEQQAQMNADMAQQNQDLQSQQAQASLQGRGIAGSALADYLAAPGEEQAATNTARAKGNAKVAGQKYDMEKVNMLKTQLVRDHLQEIDKDYGRQMDELRKSMAQLTRTTEFNVANTIQQQQDKAQADFQAAQNDIYQTLQEHTQGGETLGSIAGGILGAIPGILTLNPFLAVSGAQGGASLGGKIGRGAGANIGAGQAGNRARRF
ncbi:MAG: hypothetical protein E6R03_11965 [Hyphomicrobiaceae bacterium]|nr:MAG: hypothetical protein E6R03_11965 [Hyphomicrobiaceae bacterium]